MSRYIFSKNNRWYISQIFDPSDSQLQEKASYYTLTDDVTGPYYATGTSDSVSIGVSYVPVVEPAGADIILGVVDANGNFQPLSFSGTQASNSGSALVVQNYKTWNSTLPAPVPSPIPVGSGPFDIVGITNYTPDSTRTDTTSIILSNASPAQPQYSENDYSNLNGTYVVTSATENQYSPFARVYKHSSDSLYIYFYQTQGFQGQPGDCYWCIASSPGTELYSAILYLYMDPARALTTGTETGWLNQSYYQNVSIDTTIVQTTRPATYFSLLAKKVTGYTDNGLLRQYSTSGSQFNLISADCTPYINKVGIVDGNRLLCMADTAMLSLLLPVSGSIWSYFKGRIFPEKVEATNHGVISDSSGYFTLGQDKYFNFNSVFLTGNASRTFIFHVNLVDGRQVQFVDGVSSNTRGWFSFGWGKSGSHSLFYHFYGSDNESWLSLDPGSYILAFTFDGSSFKAYKNGSYLGKIDISLNTGTGNPYRIGQYVADDWYSSDQWKSGFCVIFDKALSADQVAAVTTAIRDYIQLSSDSISE